MVTYLSKSRKEMATSTGNIFGVEIREWLSMTEDENEVVSLLLAASYFSEPS